MGWGRAEGGSLFHCKRMGGVIIIHTITIIHTKYIVGTPFASKVVCQSYRALLRASSCFHKISDTADLADFVQEFQWSLSELEIETVGLCPSRPLPSSSDQEVEDVAYDLSSTSATINTTVESLFPNGFPEDFVLFATVKVDPDNTADLFTIMDTEQSLSFSLSPLEFEYRRRGKAPFRVRLNQSLADGAWHRVAIAVRKKHVTLSLDCAEPRGHVRRPRGFRPSFGRDSVVRLEEQFQVRIQPDLTWKSVRHGVHDLYK